MTKLILTLAVSIITPGACCVYAVTPDPDGAYPGGNTAEGVFALQNDDTSQGLNNTALGALALTENTTGSDNTATGAEALAFNVSGGYNTAIGFQALYDNNTGGYNTAIGEAALATNTDGGFNTATGAAALKQNVHGNGNTADGSNALVSNNGSNNTASGYNALYSNTNGSYNTASGYTALAGNTTGGYNTATGEAALASNTIGGFDVATGAGALNANTTGSNNTAEGTNALLHNTTGANNVALGTAAGQNLTTGSNNIDIGANVTGPAGEANTIRIGKQGTQKKTFVAGIRGVTVASGVGVIVGTTGQLGTVVSSARFKEAIKPMDKASETILQLKPVTFRYKEEVDPDAIPQFGLVAEEVDKIDPKLVIRDEQGQPFTVRYEAVNAMLLNEFLKEHRKVEEQEVRLAKQDANNAQQLARLAQQQKEIKALTAAVRKVSKQLELDKANHPLSGPRRLDHLSSASEGQ